MLRELSGPRWAIDPSGRHELRYWDGTTWTAHVSDAGVTDVDALGTDGAPPSGAVAPSAPPTPTGLARIGPVAPVDTRFWTPASGVGSAGSGAGGATSRVADGATSAQPGHGAGAAGPEGAAGLEGSVGAESRAGAEHAGPVAGSSGDWPMPVVRIVRWPSRPRTVFVLAVGMLAVVGLLAGITGFSGPPDGEPPAALPNVLPPPPNPAGPGSRPDPVLGPPPAPDLTQPSTSPVATTSTPAPSRTSPAVIATATATVTATVTVAPDQTVTAVPVVQPTTDEPEPTEPVIELLRYRSCPAMRQDHPSGVGLQGARDRRRFFDNPRVDEFTVNRALYRLNAIFDIDLDGIVCEP